MTAKWTLSSVKLIAVEQMYCIITTVVSLFFCWLVSVILLINTVQHERDFFFCFCKIQLWLTLIWPTVYCLATLFPDSNDNVIKGLNLDKQDSTLRPRLINAKVRVSVDQVINSDRWSPYYDIKGWSWQHTHTHTFL